jgi:ubiquinone/menaquinone biosynthesis C-methylase UbiE
MKQSTLELMCCPYCHSSLLLGVEHEGEIVDHGDLFCPPCERSYPIRNGVAHFVDAQELEGPNRRFARTYDRLAPIYSLFSKVVFFPFGGERKARQEILDRLDLKGGRVLEVAIGTGVNLPYLFESPDVGEVYGVDISTGQLSRCRSLANQRGWPVDLSIAMAEALPFKADTFDDVLHIGGINFFSGQKQAIHEMIRVARPGSKIVIADEAERLAKLVDRSPVSSSSYRGDGGIETRLIDLVPGTMAETRMEGIWKLHGRYHGYCLEFRKPG